jgi:phosphoglycolate phosphatase
MSLYILEKPKIFIFDLDGTLLDTLEDITYSINETLNLFNLPKISSYECKNMIGEGMQTLCEKAITYSFAKNLGINFKFYEIPNYEILKRFENEYNVSIEKFTSIMNENYNKNYLKFTKPYSGIIELLNKLKKNIYNKEIIVSVLSNKPDIFVKNLVNYFFSNYSFYPVIGGIDSNFLKPSKESIYNLLNQLKSKINEDLKNNNNYEYSKNLSKINEIILEYKDINENIYNQKQKNIKFDNNQNNYLIKNQNIILIGDSRIDMLTSKNSNILSGFVNWGFGNLFNLKEDGLIPDFIFENANQIYNLI